MSRGGGAARAPPRAAAPQQCVAQRNSITTACAAMRSNAQLLLAASLAGACVLAAASAGPVALSLAAGADGSYSVSVGGATFYASAPGALCIRGTSEALVFVSQAPASGTDALGAWTGTALRYSSAASAAPVTLTLRAWPARVGVAAASVAFPAGADTSHCSGAGPLSTSLPAWDTGAAAAPTLGVLTWEGTALSSTPAATGLAALSPKGLDSGPIISWSAAGPLSPTTPALAWSTLDSHKIVSQAVSTPPAPSAPINVTALWSASRQDQLACASALCTADQQPQGGYVVQRIEGVALTLTPTDAARGAACVNGADVAVAPIGFWWSQAHADNWVGKAPAPDGTYSDMGGNGAVVAQAGVAGTVPLTSFSRAYGSRTDWAFVASPAGLAWAAANNYTRGADVGFVFTAPPAMCIGGGAGATAAAPVYAQGLTSAVPAIPVGWNYSILYTAAAGGPTAVTYAHGANLQLYHNTTRSPSITLTDIGSYTDDGAYYYVWEAFGIPARPWPAEVGLLLVKEDLYAAGVPVAYLQLDDYWYRGKFFFGNVKMVEDWTASNASRLFPNGLAAFADKLDLPLQLYTPFWADDCVQCAGFNFTNSTVFVGTKLPAPNAARAFFDSYFDFGLAQTHGRMAAFELDFLLSNFAGSASMFESVTAASTWYAAFGDAALARGIALQLCLPSVTDILESLSHPAMVQARASGDYVNKGATGNAFEIGGSALIMGALAVAPSKDTLWTSSPQPGTMSDTEHNGLSYTTQPHVVLDVALATLSLGPVGISDAIGHVNVSLISQAFRAANDSTLLRPSRPISWVDSVFANRSAGAAAADVRATHAALPLAAGGGGATHNAHTLLAWQTVAPVTLGASDLYPPPPARAALAVRAHLFSGDAQAGCVDGAPAAPACAAILAAGAAPTLAATGAADLSLFSLTAVYEPYANGAYFLGELAKVVHVSPQRIDWLGVGGAGRAGLAGGLRGAPGELVRLTAIDAAGVVRVVDVAVPAAGAVAFEI